MKVRLDQILQAVLPRVLGELVEIDRMIDLFQLIVQQKRVPPRSNAL